MSRTLVGRGLGVALLLVVGASLMAQQRPIPLMGGPQIGRPMFEPGDTPRGGNGQPVDGIEGSSTEMLAVHIHSHLSLFYKGDQIAIPYGIGIVKPIQMSQGSAYGRALYWLHTHDATGIVHIESPDSRTYTLGNFFDIWGQPLTTTNVAGLMGTLHVFVDGKARPGDPRTIVLKSHEQITLEVGEPVVTPPVYEFPQGL